MNKIKLISGVLLVFLVGALAGSLGTGYYYKKRVEKFEAGGPPVQERVQIILGRFSNELNLTDEQRTEFEKIIKESQEKKIALGNKFQPEIKQINDDTFTSIKNKLTDEQKTKLDTLIKRMDSVHDKFPSGQRQQQRTPDQSRPQQQGGHDQGNQQQDNPQQVPPQESSDQQVPPQGTPGQDLLNVIPDSIPPKGGASRNGYMKLTGELNGLLSLSQEQERKVEPIVEKFNKDQQAVYEKYKEEKRDSKAVQTALLETENSFEKDLSGILTREQMDKYRKSKESGAIKLIPSVKP